MKHTSVAYLLWLVGGCGTLGLHRFYLGKVPTGILWLCTGGLGFLGAGYDFFTLRSQVREANLLGAYQAGMIASAMAPAASVPAQRKESLERSILRVAKANSGVVSPGEVALEADVTIAEAQKALDKLASSGFAELKVRANGSVAYFFKDFSPAGRNDFLDV